MLQNVLGFVFLLPFRLVDGVISRFLYTRQRKKEVDPIPDHALKKMRRMEWMIHNQADLLQFYLHQIVELKRQHQREMDDREARHRKKTRELRRQLSYARMRQGGQH